MVDRLDRNVVRVDRDPAELSAALFEQLAFLRSSARATDQGEQHEYKRLALTLRVLLHTGGSQSRALLDQLGVLNRLQLLDTAGENPETNLLRPQNLLALQKLTWGDAGRPSKGEYVARMTNLPRSKLGWQQQVHILAAGRALPRAAGNYVSFTEWWSMVVLTDDQGATFSRADLVKAVANTDGGGHVDNRLDIAYHAVSRSNSLGWIVRNSADQQRPFENPIPACIRQIAYEVDVSLVAAPDLFSNVDLGEAVIGPGPA